MQWENDIFKTFPVLAFLWSLNIRNIRFVHQILQHKESWANLRGPSAEWWRLRIPCLIYQGSDDITKTKQSNSLMGLTSNMKPPASASALWSCRSPQLPCLALMLGCDGWRQCQHFPTLLKEAGLCGFIQLVGLIYFKAYLSLLLVSRFMLLTMEFVL